MRVVAFVLLGLLGCSDPKPTYPLPRQRAAPTKVSFSAPGGFKQLRLGLIPFLERDTMLQNHQHLADCLSNVLGVPVEVRVADSYADAINRFKLGEYDVAEFSPLAYALANEKGDTRCLAQSISDGSATGSGYLFVREDSPRKTIEDLKGAKLGFVDPMSTSGALFARKLFKDRGFDLKKDFASIAYLGNHEAVLMAVLDGSVDVGATFQGSFSALRRSKSVDPLSFRVIAKTPRVPRDIYCVRPDLPREVSEAIAAALLNLTSRDTQGREILGPMNLNGFVPPNDHSYDEVRAIAHELDE